MYNKTREEIEKIVEEEFSKPEYQHLFRQDNPVIRGKVYDKIIDGYFYTTSDYGNPGAIQMTTGSGGAKQLYDQLMRMGLTDEQIGNELGILIKGPQFIPLNALEVKENS